MRETHKFCLMNDNLDMSKLLHQPLNVKILNDTLVDPQVGIRHYNPHGLLLPCAL